MQVSFDNRISTNFYSLFKTFVQYYEISYFMVKFHEVFLCMRIVTLEPYNRHAYWLVRCIRCLSVVLFRRVQQKKPLLDLKIPFIWITRSESELAFPTKHATELVSHLWNGLSLFKQTEVNWERCLKGICSKSQSFVELFVKVCSLIPNHWRKELIYPKRFF